MPSLLPTPEPADPVEGQPGHFEHSNWLKASVKALDSGVVHKDGDTMTGRLTVQTEDGIRLLTGTSGNVLVTSEHSLKVLSADGSTFRPVTCGEPEAPSQAATKGYVDAVRSAGIVAKGASITPGAGYSYTGYALNSGTKFGDPGATDSTGLVPGSGGFFRVSRAGYYRFTSYGTFAGSGDSVSLTGSRIVLVGQNSYVQGSYMITSLTTRARVMVGVAIQGQHYLLQEAYPDIPASVISLDMEVTAEWLGPAV